MGVKMEKFIEWCREELNDAIVSIPLFESGQMQFIAIGPNGNVDQSAVHIEHLRQVAKNMTDIISLHESINA